MLFGGVSMTASVCMMLQNETCFVYFSMCSDSVSFL